MNMIDRALGRNPVALAAASDKPRSEAIADALVTLAPAAVLGAIGTLRDLRARHTALWEALRTAVALYQRDPTEGNKRLVKDAEAAMHSLEPQIDAARAELRRAREAYAPKFEDGARRFHPAMAEKLAEALRLIGEVNAEICGINLGASRCGIERPGAVRPVSMVELEFAMDGLRR